MDLSTLHISTGDAIDRARGANVVNKTENFCGHKNRFGLALAYIFLLRATRRVDFRKSVDDSVARARNGNTIVTTPPDRIKLDRLASYQPYGTTIYRLTSSFAVYTHVHCHGHRDCVHLCM